ncbi:MAG: hypothetical protein K8R88_15245 [Armatimonadetes bacterium]|nr:hypothetical protein [Armatimonadota bacterium]
MLTSLILAYNLGPAVVLRYDLNVVFDGFIPILGGQTGKAEVQLGVSVTGGAGDTVVSEIKTFKVLFNETVLPLTLENLVEIFPKTTVQISPFGKVLKTDAKEAKVPIRLPGLDAMRFPEITYLPLEFPSDGIPEGGTWSFKRAFGGSDMSYSCSLAAGSSKITFTQAQTYETLENESLELVKDPKEAISRVVTTLNGKGEAVFDQARGVFTSVKVEGTVKSAVTDLESGEKSERNLKTSLKCTLVP